MEGRKRLVLGCERSRRQSGENSLSQEVRFEVIVRIEH